MRASKFQLGIILLFTVGAKTTQQSLAAMTFTASPPNNTPDFNGGVPGGGIVRTLTLVVSCLGCCAAAHGQLAHTTTFGTGIFSSNVANTDGFFEPTEELVNGQAVLRGNSWITARADRDSQTAQTHQAIYYNFKNEGLPVQLTDIQLQGAGKMVVAGANMDDRSSLLLSLRLHEYDDLNHNGRFDEGEPAHSLLGGDQLAVDWEFGERIEFYDTGPVPFGDILLGGGASYYFILGQGVRLDPYQILPTDPNIWLTDEFHEPPFGGHQITFNYVTVPEPHAALGTVLCLIGAVVSSRISKPVS